MTVLFPDASEYNGAIPEAPMWLCRATIGAVRDTRYTTFKSQAGARKFAAYAFLNHDALTLDVSGTGPGIPAEQQAEFAYSVIGPDVPCMLDWESNRGMDATVAMAQRFITRYRQIGGTMHTYYLPHWYWSGHLGSPDLTWFNQNQMGLVSSDYSVPYTPGGAGYAPYGGATPVWWQFTNNWLGSGCDGNGYEGTADQWWALMTGGARAMTDFGPSDPNAWAETTRLDALVKMQPKTAPNAANPSGEPMPIVATLLDIQTKLTALAAPAAPAPAMDTHAVATDVVTQLAAAGLLTADAAHTVVHAEVKSVLDAFATAGAQAA